MKFWHRGPIGEQKCTLEIFHNDEQLKKDDEEKNKLREEQRKRKRDEANDLSENDDNDIPEDLCKEMEGLKKRQRVIESEKSKVARKG